MKNDLLKRTSLFSMYSGNLGFFVRSVGECHHFPPHRQRVKVASFGEIFWCISGYGLFESDNTCHQLNPDWVWYYPPGSLHSYRPGPEGFYYRWLTIDGPQAGTLFSALGIQPGATHVKRWPDQLFQDIQDNIRKPVRQLYILQEAFKILAAVSTPGHLKHSFHRPDLAAELKQIIDEEFNDPQLNVDILAARIGRHRVTAARIFQKRYGIALSAYLMEVRRREALNLLANTEIPLENLPELCGFSSKIYFYQVVKKITGKTPATLRRAAGSENCLQNRNKASAGDPFF